MSGRSSVMKGKSGEREIVRYLQPIVDRVISKVNETRGEEGEEAAETVRLLRNSLQTAVGGHDIIGLDWFAPEVKRQETPNVQEWWKQTLESAGDKKIAVLLHRGNNTRWKCRMNGYLICSSGVKVMTPVDISFEAFLLWFEHELMARYAKS